MTLKRARQRGFLGRSASSDRPAWRDPGFDAVAVEIAKVQPPLFRFSSEKNRHHIVVRKCSIIFLRGTTFYLNMIVKDMKNRFSWEQEMYFPRPI